MTQVQPDTSRQLVQGSWGSCDKELCKHQEEGTFLCSMHAMYQLLLDPLSPLAPPSAVQLFCDTNITPSSNKTRENPIEAQTKIIHYTDTAMRIRELDGMRWRQAHRRVPHWSVGYSGSDPWENPGNPRHRLVIKLLWT
jgi:hypothetical protein